MFEKLIYALAAFTIVLFFAYILYKGNTVKSCLLFILGGLPLMNLKITAEWLGGFRTFDFICFYALIFLFKDFSTINKKKGLNLYLWLFGGLSVVLILSGLSSEFPERTWISFFRFVPIFIFGRFLVITCFKDPEFYQQVIKALKISYLLSLLFLLAQVIFGLGFTFYPTLGPNTVDPLLQMVRYPGIFYDAQQHGQYLAMGSFLFLYNAPGTSKRMQWINYSVVLFALVGMVLAGSRAPMGGFILGLLLLFFLLSSKYKVYGGFAFVIGFGAYLFFAPQNGVFQRTAGLSDDFLFRKTLWDEALDISAQSPILGIGAGNYQDHVTRHNQNQYLEIEEGVFMYFDQPENGYLKILVELGFTGLFLVAVMLLSPFMKGTVGSLKKQLNPVVALLLAALLSWMVAFSTVYSFYDYRIMILVATLVVLILTIPKPKPHEFAG